MLKTHLKAWPELLLHFVYSLSAWKLSLLAANPVTSNASPSHGAEPLAGLWLGCALRLGALRVTAWLQLSCRVLHRQLCAPRPWMGRWVDGVLLLLLLAAYCAILVLLEQLCVVYCQR